MRTTANAWTACCLPARGSVRSRSQHRSGGSQPDAAAFAEVLVHNVHGQRLQTLLSEPVGVGQLQLNWDGRTISRARAPAGIYFITAEVGDERARCTIVLRM